ncbi:hypothetical protein JYU12_01225 [bacterium AH-315-K03]|nr:hypothetical protein [bacterium AH-315-K03]
MSYYQAFIFLGVLLVIPVTSIAQEDEVTMEIIESLDDELVHHISLPAQANRQGKTDLTIGKSHGNGASKNNYNIQREQLNAIISDTEKGAAELMGIVNREIFSQKNSGDSVGDQSANSPEFQEGIAAYRAKIQERRQEIIDELKGGADRTSTAVSGATTFSQ